MRDREKGFQLKGASLAAVSLGDRAYAKIFRNDTGITFPLLVDADRAAYRAVELRVGSVFSIFRPINFQSGTRAVAAGHRQHKLGKNPFQLGGSFIFGPGNTDLYAHANETFGDNAPVTDLLAALP